MEQIFKLSHEFSETLDEIENGGDHLFITGKAGTGKSTLLDLFRRSTSKNIAILAPTASMVRQYILSSNCRHV